MRFSNDNSTYSSPESYATSKSWTLTSGDGGKTVYAKFRNVAGNWSIAYSDGILLDTAVPATTATPSGGIYGSAQSVTLTCNDGTGSGCGNIYYTTDGSTPTTASPVFSSAINISTTTTLKCFAMDLASNSETVKTETYTIDPGSCSNPPVRIGSTTYNTIQAAYNAAVTSNIIQCRNITFTENLTVDRNIIVTLEGGYDCSFTANTGGVSNIKGVVTTTTGGGKIKIKKTIIRR